MNSKTFYYFDNNATTRIAPEVVAAMMPYLTEEWGNPSSAYTFAQGAARALATAREQVASLIGADPKEVLFTSCGTITIIIIITTTIIIIIITIITR